MRLWALVLGVGILVTLSSLWDYILESVSKLCATGVVFEVGDVGYAGGMNLP